MKPEYIKKIKDDLKVKFKEQTNRDPKPNEESNMMTDALALARFAVEQIDLLEDRIIKLEKKPK